MGGGVEIAGHRLRDRVAGLSVGHSGCGSSGRSWPNFACNSRGAHGKIAQIERPFEDDEDQDTRAGIQNVERYRVKKRVVHRRNSRVTRKEWRDSPRKAACGNDGYRPALTILTAWRSRISDPEVCATLASR